MGKLINYYYRTPIKVQNEVESVHQEQSTYDERNDKQKELELSKLRSPSIGKYSSRQSPVVGRPQNSVSDNRFEPIKNDFENLSKHVNSKKSFNFGL